jgi:glycosyltransferase involved in cell wall biosynthesis
MGMTALSKRKKVAMFLAYVPDYRIYFLNCLRRDLEQNNIDLQIFYGTKAAANITGAKPEFGTVTAVHEFFGIIWQRGFRSSADCDLIIVPQQSKQLLLYLQWFRSLVTGQRIALWGHGKNFQGLNPNSPAERVKRGISKHVDWWFSYNQVSADVVSSLGYPKERITLTMNAIDTKRLSNIRAQMTSHDIDEMRKKTSISSSNVAVYTGGFYSEKRLEFLMNAAARVRREIPDFELIIIGKGPDASIVEKASARVDWIHYLGAKNDMEKVPYWAISKLLLMPGAVGLVVLDSFALGIPMVTTAVQTHGPEIDYLDDGVNGTIIQEWDNAESYAIAVVNLLCDESRRQKMSENCLSVAENYTIEKMAELFAKGICSALSIRRYSGFRFLDWIRR